MAVPVPGYCLPKRVGKVHPSDSGPGGDGNEGVCARPWRCQCRALASRAGSAWAGDSASPRRGNRGSTQSSKEITREERKASYKQAQVSERTHSRQQLRQQAATATASLLGVAAERARTTTADNMVAISGQEVTATPFDAIASLQPQEQPCGSDATCPRILC